MFNLEKRKVLLTGASGGIGNSILRLFVKSGATVAASGSNLEKLNEICSEFKHKAIPIQCNLSNEGEANTLVEKAVSILGGLDILVCNAGLNKDGLSMRMKDNDWIDVIEVNLTATFRLNREAIKEMIKKKFGRIINMSSVVAYTGNPGQANYAASKGGIISMSKSLALEVAKRGITVNCVAPGFIDTPMTKKLSDKIKDEILNHVPMGFMGEPEDVAAGVLYLASNEAKYVTGTTLHINGGMF